MAASHAVGWCPSILLTITRLALASILLPVASLLACFALAYTVPRRLAEKARTNSGKTRPWLPTAFALPLGAVAGAAAGIVALGPATAACWALFGAGAPEQPFSFRTIDENRRQNVPREREERANAVRRANAEELSFRDDEVCGRSTHIVSPLGSVGRGVLVMHHGLHSHGGAARMLRIASHFARRGFVVYSLDAEGHGRSGGNFGVISSLEGLARTFAEAIEEIASRHPRSPIFLKGASMGGLMALWAPFFLGEETRTKRLRGIVSVCPALAVGDAAKSKFLIEAFKLAPADVLGRIFPQLPLTKGPRGVSFSEDPVLRKLAEQESDEDPLEYKGRLKFGTALTFTQTLMDPEECSRLTSLLQTSRVPTLIQHGTADRCVDVAGSRTFFEGLQCEGKKLVTYNGKSHVLLSEDEKTCLKYLHDMYDFVASQT